MIRMQQFDTIEGTPVFDDDTSPSKFYLLPNTPRFRINPETGLPVMAFMKYRNPRPRGDGMEDGGGFVIFDTELAVEEARRTKIREALQEKVNQRNPAKPPVQLGDLSFIKGSVALNLLDNGGKLVEKVYAATSPSLYGTLVAPFTAELSQTGATLLEEALQGQGGVVQVMYDVFTYAKLPPVKANIWFNASKFMNFHQEVDVEWNACAEDDYRETIRETFTQHEAGGVDLDFGAVTDEKIKSQLRDWGWRTLEDALKRMVLGDIPPVSEDARKLPDGIENLYRDITVQKVASFRRSYKEGHVIEWNPGPRGTLPNITSLKGKDGKPLKWAEFARTVDLDDPFFRTLAVRVLVGADFARLPIDSVEVKLRYKTASKTSIGEFIFTKDGMKTGPSDAIVKLPTGDEVFSAFVNGGDKQYEYEYEVSYKGSSKTLKAPLQKTDDAILKINVDDAGVLAVDLVPGDIDFEQVKSAHVTLEYSDPASGVALISESFTLTKESPTAQFQRAIFQARTKPYRYKVKYSMAGGREYTADWNESHSRTLHVNDPFAAIKTVAIRPIGNFETRVDSIFLDLVYEDRVAEYKLTKSISLNKDNPFLDWDIPVLDETRGKLSYAGVVRLKDGTVIDIPQAETTAATLVVGPPTLRVQVMPDLLDWERLKLVKVTLRYQDAAHGINETQDVVFKKGATEAQTWEFEILDRARKQYTWEATFFLSDNTQKKTGPTDSADETIIPEIPA